MIKSTVLEQALLYRSLGLSVIPVPTGTKKPVIPWKHYQHNKPSEAEIVEWFTKSPDSNIGIVTGRVSGLVVLDVDTPGVSFSEYTPTVQSARGLHYYFAYPRGVERINGVIQGLGELRGDGGLIIAPPSVHPSGHRYSWIIPAGQPLAPLPERFLGFARMKGSDAIMQGERNATLTSVAGKLRRAGMDAANIAAALQEVNLERCRPPLNMTEVDAIARSVARYAPATADGEKEVSDSLPRLFGVAPGIGTWLENPAPAPDWLVEGLILRGTINMLDGLGGSGKSTLINQLVLSLATGTPFLGKATKQGRVLVVNAEDPGAENHRRMRNVAHSYKCDGVSEDILGKGADNVAFVSLQDITVSPALRDRAGNPTRAFEDILVFVESWGPDLVIFDPLVYFFAGDENSTADAIAFYSMMKQLKTTILFIHHQNKDGQKTGNIKTSARGSIVFTDNARTRMVLGDNKLQVVKINYHEPYTLDLTFRNGIWSVAKKATQDADKRNHHDD